LDLAIASALFKIAKKKLEAGDTAAIELSAAFHQLR
jgi:hypothetical protein